MRIGALLQATRHRLRGGLQATWYREVVTPRILQTPPVRGLTDPTCEVHALTCAADWLCLMWGLKSFYRFSGRRYRLCIHGDPSLGQEAAQQLRAHFPEARIVEHGKAEEEVLPWLKDHPRCQSLRRTNHLAPKVFDTLHYATTDRLMILDSDVLFFAAPSELLSRIEDVSWNKNTLNRDVASAYTVEPGQVRERLGFELVARVNSGLGLIHRRSLDLDWLEEFLGLTGITSHFWRIEQTLFALCSSRHGVELLPDEYDVTLSGWGGGPCRHYVGAIRPLFFAEGVRRLHSQRSLVRASAY